MMALQSPVAWLLLLVPEAGLAQSLRAATLVASDAKTTAKRQPGVPCVATLYRFSGRDIRLTDVHGRVVEELLS